MSLAAGYLVSGAPLWSQFLAPDETVKIPAPAEIPTQPQPQPAPQPAPVAQPAPQPQPVQVAPQPAMSQQMEAATYFADIAAYGREKNIILTWHLVSGRAIDKRIQIYRFTEEPRVIHDISRGILVAKLTGEINLFEDVPPARGTYYYAMFLETNRGLEPVAFTPSRNLVGPVLFGSNAIPMPQHTETRPAAPVTQYARPEFESREIDDNEEIAEVREEKPDRRRGINAVIRKTFMRGEYAEAVRALKPFLRNSSPRVRAKAMFYTGLARFRLEQYERALKYFEHPLTQKYYKRNAEFWVNRTSENISTP